MSGRVAPLAAVEIGAPPLASTNFAAAPAPTSREKNTCCAPGAPSSQIAHGTVGLAGFIVPAATRGSSASAAGLAFSEHAFSFPTLCPQKPPPLELSSTPCAPLPTAVQLKPPSTVPVGGVVTD